MYEGQDTVKWAIKYTDRSCYGKCTVGSGQILCSLKDLLGPSVCLNCTCGSLNNATRGQAIFSHLCHTCFCKLQYRFLGVYLSVHLSLLATFTNLEWKAIQKSSSNQCSCGSQLLQDSLLKKTEETKCTTSPELTGIFGINLAWDHINKKCM